MGSRSSSASSSSRTATPRPGHSWLNSHLTKIWPYVNEEEIHELLLSFAEAGATVVRLKGGEPLVFGRGGEEMDFLQKQGIQVQVIPGTIMNQY
ncbi:S-adenosyl-L-methionine-dependent uroporphyrinogen III methyltransferase, chloroplastic-like [Rosa rugosa]|uniref:S-adenosyl-L-methionine-dependent uroporphyrinogen III methyltransferase, chloroplastic-like n=1 Tax=Rosa rugosa TaxID=74645 RepID=UPI002B40E48D|nr:S-adenosyl-L-methionine-dependent uroporphyrinogen III methyltransferase, chloroplastic-like [Rosa rugosa]